MAYKRILTIQDISCVGQCSMTVALPVLAACGVETCILPTAVLSTHTGGFQKPQICHLAKDMSGFCEHWQRENIEFDAVYTGYLGSVEAIACAEQIIDSLLAPGGLVIIDPAMADHGKLYSGFDEEYAKAMSRLCRKANILLPNITEAAILTGLPYREDPDEGYVQALLEKLGSKCTVLTGIGSTHEETGAAVWENGRIWNYSHPKVARNYHGTGDLFAAAFTGALLQGRNLHDAVRIAADFTALCIRKTFDDPAHWYGVKFETALPDLIQMLQQ